jgi:hypothetical protein
MSKARRIIYIVWPLLLAACTETPQTIGGSNARGDTPAYRGADNPFQAAGWKAGDRTSWESHMTARTQRGQNEYNKLQ